jgi:hypothetical protein
VSCRQVDTEFVVAAAQVLDEGVLRLDRALSKQLSAWTPWGAAQNARLTSRCCAAKRGCWVPWPATRRCPAAWMRSPATSTPRSRRSARLGGQARALRLNLDPLIRFP